MDKTLDLDELERVAREALDDRGTTSPRVAIPADDLLTLIAAARPAVVSDEVVERMAREYHIGIHGGHEASAIPRHRRVEAMRAALALLPGVEGEGSPCTESAAGDASHLTASETPCKSEWPNPACPCTDPLWCIQRELCKRTTQEPPSPTPCDLEGK